MNCCSTEHVEFILCWGELVPINDISFGILAIQIKCYFNWREKIVLQYISRRVLFQRFQERILGFCCKDQSEVWCLYLFLLPINTVFMIDVPFISGISYRRET